MLDLNRDANIELDLPYITRELPGIGGELRATPEHFIVEEIALYTPQGDGQHLYVNLTKVGMTTKEVQEQLARLFRLRSADVSFAGMKDKHARTTQTFSLNVGHQSPATVEQFLADSIERIRDHLDVEVHWANLHRNKLRLGHLLGNRFTITITNLENGLEDAVARSRAIVDEMARVGVPNFFGPQRFGASGGNVRQGMAMLLGEREKSARWLRRLLSTAYQSYLCNRYLARRVEMGAFHHLLTGDVAKKHATGGMFEVVDAAVEQPRYEAQEISFTAPMYGPKMWAATGEAAELEAEILATSPVTMEHFEKFGIEGTRRLGRLLLPDCSVESNETLQGLTVSFALPKGAFATTILREIMKVDESRIAALEDDGDDAN
jgi:tRNA pseudouridine13 synthase